MNNNLVGKQIIINQNDFIWEYEVLADVSQVNNEKDNVLLELKDPLTYKNKIYSQVVVSGRHENGSLSDLYSTGYYACNATWIPDDKFDEQKPFDTSWWRGGAAAVTSISLKIPERGYIFKVLEFILQKFRKKI